VHIYTAHTISIDFYASDWVGLSAPWHLSPGTETAFLDFFGTEIAWHPLS
jgi:hypothetical protein